jgi:hypothetical protein
VLAKERTQQPGLQGIRRNDRQAFWEMGDGDTNPVLPHCYFEARRTPTHDGFLDDKDAMPPRTAGQQVLRTLKDEVPSQVAERDDVWRR